VIIHKIYSGRIVVLLLHAATGSGLTAYHQQQHQQWQKGYRCIACSAGSNPMLHKPPKSSSIIGIVVGEAM